LFRPTTIEFGVVIVGELKSAVTVRVTETFPERDCDFDAVVGGKLKQVGQRVGSHGVIVTRLERTRKVQCGPPAFRQSIPVFASISGL
jgi:hypothetical protein